MKKKQRKFKKMKSWFTGNPIDFSMGEKDVVIAWFVYGLDSLISEIPKSGRAQIKLIFKRIK